MAGKSAPESDEPPTVPRTTNGEMIAAAIAGAFIGPTKPRRGHDYSGQHWPKRDE